MTTKFVCISDTHGFLPTDLPDGDILLHSGDICPTYDHSISFQQQWIHHMFMPYLKKLESKYRAIIFIGGNHDWVLEKGLDFSYLRNPMLTKPHEIYYLQDSSITIDGIKIWGTPHQLTFYNWAFNLDEPDLAKKWELIPKDTDVIVCHGPAYGYGDSVYPRTWQNEEKYPEVEHVGSPSMLKKIEEIRPKLYVCGHVHEGRGVYKRGSTIIVNASYLDASYKPYKKEVTVIEI